MARATRWTGHDTSGWCSQSHRLPRCVGLQALPTTHGWSLCAVPPIVVNRKPLDPNQAPGDRGELSARIEKRVSSRGRTYTRNYTTKTLPVPALAARARATSMSKYGTQIWQIQLPICVNLPDLHHRRAVRKTSLQPYPNASDAAELGYPWYTSHERSRSYILRIHPRATCSTTSPGA